MPFTYWIRLGIIIFGVIGLAGYITGNAVDVSESWIPLSYSTRFDITLLVVLVVAIGFLVDECQWRLHVRRLYFSSKTRWK